MAKVDMNTGGIGQIYGRVNGKNKRTGYYYRRGFNNETILVQADWKEQNFTANQLAAQVRFATAASQAAEDMKDPQKKSEWQAVAESSNGKWRTARGAAFSSYYSQAEE